MSGNGFDARYRSECWACGDDIAPGERIERAPVDGVAYQHVECPAVSERRATKFQGTSLDQMGF